MIMTSYTLVVLLLFASSTYCRNIKIGILMPETAPHPGFPSIETSGGAVMAAVEEASRRYSQNVTVMWKDTGCDEGLSIITAYDLGKDQNVEVIIGPACAKCMDLVAKLMSVLKPSTPILTWLPRSEGKSHPNDTAISTFTTFEDITDALIVTFRHFSWKQVAIIASRMELCVPLIETVNDVFPNNDLNIMRVLYMDTFTPMDLRNALIEARDHARIILLCLQSELLPSLLQQADQIGMTANEFVFIYCRFGVSPLAGLHHQFMAWDQDTRARLLSPLLQIGTIPVDEAIYQDFVRNSQNTTFPDAGPNCCNQTDEFAASLYDTVLLAVDLVITANTSALSYDYSQLQRSFHSISGPAEVTPEGKIARPIALAYYQDDSFVVVSNLNGSYRSMTSLHWPGGNVPSDSPKCGWTGDECENDDQGNNRSSVIIGSCVAMVVVLVAAALVFLYYRKSRFEKELMSMIWKVNNNEIKMRRPRANTQTSIHHRDNNDNTHPRKKLVRADTRGTLGLGSTSSIDKTVLFAPVGSYKGSIVAVKDIKRRSIQMTAETLRDLNALRQLQHENLNPFIGVSLEPGNSYILMKYCAKGSLHDILENEDIKLDSNFKMSFLLDLSRGLECLHKSVLKSHGNLKSTNCVIDSRWVLKLTDYGAVCASPEEEMTSLQDTDADVDQYARLLWTAPELLRMHRRIPKGSQKADVYSFAVIMQEILLRVPPYYLNGASSNKVIISRVRKCEDPPYRPRLVEDETHVAHDKLVAVMRLCWQECPDVRPDVHTIIKMLIDVNGRGKTNIMDNMIMMLEAYSNNLEELVANRTEELDREKQKTDTLLYQMLPPLVAEQLKRGDHVKPETFSEASIFFSDIVGFTSLSGSSTPLQVIDLLNDLYTTFDEIIGMHDVYKVETIGDAYMVASGIPRRNGQRHAGEIANMALDLLSAVTNFRIRHMPGAKLQLRIGLHTGPCAAGVVGLTMPRYCLFGDTVNMASRMESTGKALHIHVSGDFAEGIRPLNMGFQLLERGVIEVKGKGLQKTYWLIGKTGYKATLPDEIQKLQETYKACEESGRPPSPTGTHISMGSEKESTSMYGSAFRRASNAIIFIRKFSQYSRESSPTGSKLTVRDIEEDRDINTTGASDTLTIPNNSPIPPTTDTSNLKLPKINVNGPIKASDDQNNDIQNDIENVCNLPTEHHHHHHKKKKKKKKHKHKDKDNRDKDNNLNVPEITITENEHSV